MTHPLFPRIRINPSQEDIPPLPPFPTLTPPHTRSHKRKPTPPNPHPRLLPLNDRIKVHLRRPFPRKSRLFAEQGGGRFLLVDRVGAAVDCEVVGRGREGVEGFERGAEVVPAEGECVCGGVGEEDICSVGRAVCQRAPQTLLRLTLLEIVPPSVRNDLLRHSPPQSDPLDSDHLASIDDRPTPFLPLYRN